MSVPVGPVNLTVINQALRRGFGAAFLMGLGAIFAESLYASLMLWGHTSILDEPRVVLILRIVAVVVIAGLGARYLLFKTERLDVSEAAAQRLDERWHHPQSFFLGFALTITNFMLVVVWATIVTLLFAHEWVTRTRASRGPVHHGGSCWWHGVVLSGGLLRLSRASSYKGGNLDLARAQLRRGLSGVRRAVGVQADSPLAVETAATALSLSELLQQTR